MDQLMQSNPKSTLRFQRMHTIFGAATPRSKDQNPCLSSQ